MSDLTRDLDRARTVVQAASSTRLFVALSHLERGLPPGSPVDYAVSVLGRDGVHRIATEKRRAMDQKRRDEAERDEVLERCEP